MNKLLFTLTLFCATAFAQSYPTKPVRLIVTYPPGGSSDLMARVFGAKLTELWGQQVIVESKPGAAGAIGTEYAARQPADGYTFMIGNSGPVAINPLLSQVPYNVEKDFIPVSQISAGPNVLVSCNAGTGIFRPLTIPANCTGRGANDPAISAISPTTAEAVASPPAPGPTKVNSPTASASTATAWVTPLTCAIAADFGSIVG